MSAEHAGYAHGASSAPAGPGAGPQPAGGAGLADREAKRSLPPADPTLQQRAVAGLFVALLSLAGLLGLSDWRRGAYVAAFALIAGAVAVWLAATALVRARRARAAHPRGAVVAVVVGAVGVAMSGVLLVTFAVLGKQLSRYGDCLSGANTIASQQACYSQFQHTVARELAVLRSAGRP